MPTLTISEVAKQVGLRTSAIRYYEQIGLIAPPERVSGQRSYDASVFYRLSIVQRAQQSGFTLEEIQQLFSGFVEGTPAPERWKELSTRKLAELAEKMSEIQFMQGLLREMLDKCHCDTLETCGKGIFHQISGVSDHGDAACSAPK
jgi:MerR family transcriptional regulator, redox-sensitive transcriptional activator SoxR